MKKYQQIEEILNLPIITYKDFIKFKSQDISFLNSEKELFGIILSIDNTSNPLKKILQLFNTSLKIRLLKLKLGQQRFQFYNQYGVYPDENNPVAIYELSTQAEIYSNLKILPQLQNNLNGKIRKFVMNIIKFHPSLGAIILVVRQT